jgi:hypothetical protein
VSPPDEVWPTNVHSRSDRMILRCGSDVVK